MKNCNIVNDLLPLYLDGVCSEESKKLVEEHLSTCSSCHDLMETMKTDLPAETIRFPSDEEVLKKTSFTISLKTIRNIVGVTSIILSWLMYLLLKSFSEIGDYRYFSYEFLTFWRFWLDLIPILILLWLGILVFRSFRDKTWKRNIILILTLLTLFCGRAIYRNYRAELVELTTWREITRIPDDYHIEIMLDETTTVTLSTNPTITNLLKTDGSEYLIRYEFHPSTPQIGKLIQIKQGKDSTYFYPFSDD